MTKKESILAELNFRNISRVLGKESRRRLLVLSVLRVLANGLDIVGVAGIALLATSFGALASGSGQAASLSLPLSFELLITEKEAVLIALIVAVVFITKSGFSILLNLKTALFVARISSDISKNLANGFFQIRQSRPTARMSVSDFQNLAIQSTVGIETFLNSRILFLSEGSLLISLLMVFLIVNPIAAVALTAFMGAVLYAMNNLINLGLRRNGRQLLDGSQTALQSSRDLHGIKREAQSAGVVLQWLEKFNGGRAKMANSQAIINTLNGLPRFVIETTLILGIFIFIGGVVVLSDIPSQAVTIGVFFAGGLRIVASVIPFQGAISGMRSGAATGQFAFEVVENYLNGPSENPNRDSTVKAPFPKLSFNQVSFSYEEPAEQILKDVSFEVEPHTRVAIVGPSGAGKSTILDLAMGFLVPEQGEVLLGTQSVREILMNHPGTFAVVPQRPHLVSGSLLENVSLVPEGETDRERVREVLIRSGLERLTAAEKWPYQEIRPDSGQLSGGEIQRLSLARALYRKPKILFLDEATSALDMETELEITRVLEDLKGEMTVILIAHRLSTVKTADKIIYLNNGEIVAEGTFKALKSKVKDFARAVEIMDLEG